LKKYKKVAAKKRGKVAAAFAKKKVPLGKGFLLVASLAESLAGHL